MVRHHLLEIILWPNIDGTFTEIRNTQKRLKDLGIYNDYKLTIIISRSEHAALHFKGITKSEEHKHKISKSHIGKLGTNNGKKFTDEHRYKISESNKGKIFTEEHRRKLSESHKGKHHKSSFKNKHWKVVNGKRVWY